MLISPAIPSITSNPADTSIVLIRTGVDAYKERSMKNGKTARIASIQGTHRRYRGSGSGESDN